MATRSMRKQKMRMGTATTSMTMSVLVSKESLPVSSTEYIVLDVEEMSSCLYAALGSFEGKGEKSLAVRRSRSCTAGRVNESQPCVLAVRSSLHRSSLSP